MGQIMTRRVNWFMSGSDTTSAGQIPFCSVPRTDSRSTSRSSPGLGCQSVRVVVVIDDLGAAIRAPIDRRRLGFRTQAPGLGDHLFHRIDRQAVDVAMTGPLLRRRRDRALRDDLHGLTRADAEFLGLRAAQPDGAIVTPANDLGFDRSAS